METNSSNATSVSSCSNTAGRVTEGAAFHEQVEQFGKQPGLRSELVVHRHARDAGAFRDRVEGKRANVVQVQDVTGGDENTLAAGVDGALAFLRDVRAGGHTETNSFDIAYRFVIHNV